MFKVSRIGPLYAILLIGGCNFFVDNPPDTQSKSGLKAFTSQQEFTEYFAGQVAQRNSSLGGPPRDEAEDAGDGAPPAAPGADADSGNGMSSDLASLDPNYSGTTTQEAGVDEADVVKTDGTYLYVITTKNDGSALRIVQASPLQLISETILEGYGRDLYLHDDKIVAITSGGGLFYYVDIGIEPGLAVPETRQDDSAGDDGVADSPPLTGEETDDGEIIIDEPPFVYERPYTLVSIIDVTNKSAPTISSNTKFDGSPSSSRMINGVLHIVLANYQNYFYDVLPALGRPEFDASTVTGEVVLPTYVRKEADGSETTGNVLSWNQLYRPEEPDGFGIVSLVSLDVDNAGAFTAVGVVAEPGLIYSSTQALYLTNTQYDFAGNERTSTNLYKFAYVDRGTQPVATGAVPGRVLNQYSMGEHNGYLRVATTVDARFECNIFECVQVEEAHNNVYVLAQTEGALTVAGSVENIAPRETIQSARFIGDRGYVVTFEQIDPLFTLDLSDPANPRVVGELQVPGFSTFLVPMDANHILAVGNYIPPPPEIGPGGVQLSIFDVSDFANPVRTANVIIGQETGAYSEATWDPKAFTYFAQQGRVALPVTIYNNFFGGGGGAVPPSEGEVVDGSGGSVDGTTTGTVDDPAVEDGTGDEVIIDDVFDPFYYNQFEGLVVFNVNVEGGISEVGRIDTRFEEAGFWYASFTRGVFIGEKIHAVTDLGVHSADVSNMAGPVSELFFGLPYDDVEPPIVIEPMPEPGGEVPPSDTDGVVEPEVPVDDGSSSAPIGG